MNVIAKTACSLLEQEVEAKSVVIGEEDRLSTVAAENDVIKAAIQMYSRSSCHAAKISHKLNLSTWKPDPTAVPRRRTKVVGAFPDGHSALMLCAARLRHIAGTQWGSKRYLNIDLLKEQEMELKFQIDEAI